MKERLHVLTWAVIHYIDAEKQVSREMAVL